jgi:Aromatic acid exporter family member 1
MVRSRGMTSTVSWPHRQLDRARPILADEGPTMLRILVASVVSWQLCIWLGAHQPPIFAVIVPLVAMRDAPYAALNVSITRLVGVVGGVCIGIAVLHVIRPSALAVAVVLAIALPFGMLLRVGGAFNVQVAISALLVFANSDPDSYAANRLWETVVGAAVTVILAPLLFPPNPYRTFVASQDEVIADLADELRAGARLTGGDDLPALGRLVDRVMATEAKARRLPSDLAAVRRAIRVHPRWRRRYAESIAGLVPLADTTAHVALLTRVFAEELADLAHRTDLHEPWAASGPRTRDVVDPLSRAVVAALSGGDATADVRATRAAFDRYRTADPSGFGAVSRRPLRRIVDALDQLSAVPSGSTLHLPTTPNT